MLNNVTTAVKPIRIVRNLIEKDSVYSAVAIIFVWSLAYSIHDFGDPTKYYKFQ